MTVAKKSEKKSPSVPPRRREDLPLSRKSLRIVTPPSDPRGLGIALTGDSVLSAAERRARDLALVSLAKRRREAEARAGSVRLS